MPFFVNIIYMLKINKLTLKDFMCINYAELDFTDIKTVLFIGSNGSGKSSVMNAIALCLNDEKKGDRYQDYIKKRKQSCSISLDADLKGSNIKIEVEIFSRGNSNRKAIYKGKEYTNSEVNSLLQSLEMSYYYDIMMSQQDDEDITKMSAAKREQFLKKLLDFDFSPQIDKVKTVQSSTKDSIIEKTSNIKVYKSFIEDNNKTVEKLKNELLSDDDIKQVQDKINTAQIEMKKANVELENENNTFEKRDILSKELELLSKELSLLKDKIALNDNKISEIDNYKKELEQIQVEKDKKLQEIQQIKSEISELDNEGDVLHKESTDLTAKIDDLSSKKSTLEVNCKLLENKYQAVSNGVCQTCGHKYETSEVETFKQELEKCQADLKDIIQQIRELKSSKSDLSTKIQNLHADRLSKVVQVQSFKETEFDIRTNFVESKIKELESILLSGNDIIEINKNILSKESRKSELSDILAVSSIDNRPTLKSIIDDKQKEINLFNEKLSKNDMIKKSILDTENKISGLKVDVAKLEEDIKELYQIESKNSSVLGLLEKTFPNYLIVKTCEILQNEINNFIHTVFSEIEVRLFQNKKGVEFFYTTEKSKQTSWKKEDLINAKIASGFEKSVLSMAFKVALSKAYNLPFAFLDEVDSAGTDQNSELLFKAIINGDIFEQVFIVSHKPFVRDTIKSIADKLKVYYVNKGIFTENEED